MPYVSIALFEILLVNYQLVLTPSAEGLQQNWFSEGEDTVWTEEIWADLERVVEDKKLIESAQRYFQMHATQLHPRHNCSAFVPQVMQTLLKTARNDSNKDANSTIKIFGKSRFVTLQCAY